MVCALNALKNRRIQIGTKLMDQTILNWIFCVLTAIIGWLCRTLWDSVANLKNKLQDIEVNLPSNYVKKDELESRFDKLEAMLNRIFEKLDSKVDKH
jgi:hypothetical protein